MTERPGRNPEAAADEICFLYSPWNMDLEGFVLCSKNISVI
jgi:hypothetical protein